MPPDWPHSPVHRFAESGAYMITASTYLKEHHFRTKKRLDFLQEQLLCRAEAANIDLQAWAIFSNHYHFVACVDEPQALKEMIHRLHSFAARFVNDEDGTRGRQVFFQYRDTKLTDPRSFYPRMRYVMENPVRHGLVLDSVQYPWCSAAEFLRQAPAPMQKTVSSFKIDQVRVPDDFEPVMPV